MQNVLKDPVSNTKLTLLTKGMDVDFKTLKQEFPSLKEKYKVNQIKVSDRHFINVNSPERDYIPDEIIVEKNNKAAISKTYYNSVSPISLSVEKGRFVFRTKKNDEILPVKVKLLPKREYTNHVFNGFKPTRFVQFLGTDRISIVPYDGCQMWQTGEQCKFCGANPTRLKMKNDMPTTPNLKQVYKNNLEKWWGYWSSDIISCIKKTFEKIMETEKLKPHFHLTMTGGALINYDFSWKIVTNLIEELSGILNFNKIDSYVALMPPKDLTLIDKIHDKGIKNVCFNMECFNKTKFKQICPGKQEGYGYENMINALEYAKNVCGHGHSRTNIVFGLESLDSTKKGASNLARKGITTDYSLFFPRPGSEMHNKKQPSTSKIVEFNKFLASVYRKNNLKPFCCPLSSRSSMANEVYLKWF